MKLLTYQTAETEPRLGFLHNNQVIDMEDFGEISNFPLPSDMLELIDMGIELVEELNDMVADTPENFFEEIAYSLDEVTILAPIQKPRKNIIGIGLNYTEHVSESARTLDTTGKLPQKPIIFSKPPTTVTGPNTEVIKNTKLTSQLDWEVELAVVIGKKRKICSQSRGDGLCIWLYGYQ
jgi:2-keto-4-pentenoate hydratase/2-oxohepta-3-ene-1,7-dioic acid hydratase in catechol pathway